MLRNIRSITGIFVLITLTLYCRCTSSDNVDVSRPIDGTLRGKEISISSFLYKPKKVLLTNNYLVVYDEAEKDLFKLFSYPDINFLFSWGQKGKGPEEFETIVTNSIESTPNGFRLLDLFTFEKYEILPSNELRLTNYQELTKEKGLLNGFVVLNDSLFIADAFDGRASAYEHVFLYPRERSGERFGQYPDEGLVFDEPIQKAMYYNKVGVSNPGEKKMMFFYYNLNMVKIYDYSGKLLREVNIDLGESSKMKSGKIVFAEPHSVGDKVFVLHVNKSNEELLNNAQQFSPELLVLDWEANILGRFILDKPVNLFTVSERHNKIYGVNFDGGNTIYEFNLPELAPENSDTVAPEFYTFENKFYHAKIPKHWILPHYVDNPDTVVDRKIDYNYIPFSNENSVDLPCGSGFSIVVYLPDTSDLIDKTRRKIYESFLGKADHNYEMLNQDTVLQYDDQKEAIHPEGFEMQLKIHGWLWEKNNKVFHVRYTGCKEFDTYYELVKTVVFSITSN